MAAPADAAPAAEAGVFKVNAQPSMGGTWALTLDAKVPGEIEPVRGTVTVMVPK